MKQKKKIREKLYVNPSVINAILQNDFSAYKAAVTLGIGDYYPYWRSQAISHAFTWEISPQGHYYWLDIYMSQKDIPEEALSFLRWITYDIEDTGEDE